MGHKRAIALLASMVTALAMMLGLTGTAVQATRKPYPPPPPSLVVDRGVVKHGSTVHATGRKFGGRERVYITVTFRAAGSHRFRTVRTAVVKTNRNGQFSFNMRAFAAGIVVITAKGSNSRTGASASVYVIDKRKGGSGWTMRRSSYTAGTPAVAGQPQEPTSNTSGLAIAGLGVLALAGSALITQQALRRRRTAKS
jgi:hypothetical protein